MTMAAPLVSVVLPVYNAEKYVGQAIQSILDQSFPEWELIVVDDGSTDKSLAIVQSFSDPRIRVLAHGQNLGYPVAMNTGIGCAKGKYVARMDADDVSHPERLARQVAFLEEHDEFCFVGCRRYLLTPSGIAVYPPPMDPEYLVERWEDLLEHRRVFVDASVLIPRALVLKAGGYRTYQRTGQDVDLWLRVLELGRPMATLTEPLYGQRLHPKSLTYSLGTKYQNLAPRARARQRAAFGVESAVPVDAASLEVALEVKHWRMRRLWTMAALCIELGDYDGAWSFFLEALPLMQPSAYGLAAALTSGVQIVAALLSRAFCFHPKRSSKIGERYIRF